MNSHATRVAAGQAALLLAGGCTGGDVGLPAADIARIDLPDAPGGRGLQGLLGSDILSGFGRITIDYRQENLRLGPR